MDLGKAIMALYDDKRFILSLIRHSFIYCDDSSVSDQVMFNEHSRYPTESLYHHPFDYDSDEEYDPYDWNSDDDFEEEGPDADGQGEESLSRGRISQEDIDLFKGKYTHLSKS